MSPCPPSTLQLTLHTSCVLAGNGRSKPVCVKNSSPEAIQEAVYWLRNSHGRGQVRGRLAVAQRYV